MGARRLNVSSSGAVLSNCGLYRYYLQRTWVEGRGRLCFVMLNPSTADSIDDDATIRICMGRAASMGLGGIDVVNLFALRATQPARLYDTPHPISEPNEPYKNDLVIQKMVQKKETHMVICAWGSNGEHMQRGKIVLGWLKEWGVVPHALRVNKDGSPAHPLRIGYDQMPFIYERRYREPVY